MATEIAELDFSLDDFHNQKVLRGADAYARLIQRLLFMRKGTYPTIPDMGIDISSYRFADLDVLTAGDLKNTIQQQCDTYIEHVPIQDISISTVKKISIAMLQDGGEIINTRLKVEKPKLINVPRGM